ncbi:hypothetical protein Rhe02_16600 [Rhizocola hellebori]|uniref:Secreted protein n=1 Tax=Rhizocola hellebori TaxID=1392758 RepID=A0A8J3Q5C7_9ACTN|nr:hypothetical protein [Rhizocola hellebori]GIH03593.1 hypothetical protein Rhe02_16600 [Rhizocola hellebori]
MSSTQSAVLAIVLVALALCSLGVWWWRRSRLPRPRPGSEYDRVVAQSETRLAADRELRDRYRQRATQGLSELSPLARERYAVKWQELYSRLTTSAQQAVNDADDLVSQLIAELGYPAREYYEQLAQTSVNHAATLDSYREAHQISLSNRRGEATAEQLRLAVAHFRMLVPQLLGEPIAPSSDVQPHPAGQHQ